MEILKRVFLAGLVFIILSGYSQNEDKVFKAFSESYDYESQGQYNEAINSLKNVYDEDSYEINLRLGWLYYMSGLFSESLPYYQKSLKLKPLSIEARIGLTYPNSAMGNWSIVENMYNQILEIEPGNPKALYGLGTMAYGREDYKEALKYLNPYINHYPFDYDGLIILAWTYYKMGDTRKARIMFNKTLLNKPHDKSAIEGLLLLQK